MDPLIAFVIVIAMVSLLVLKVGLQPFLSLLLTAIVYGLLLGTEGTQLIGYITTGMARVFSTLAIVIFCGAVIADYLRATHAMDRIVADLQYLAGRKRGLLVSGFSGYLVSLPAMCCITSYMILEPVMKDLGKEVEGSGTRFQFMVAISSIISFVLIYPSPVMVSLTTSLGVSPSDALRVGLPVSALLLASSYIYVMRMPGKGAKVAKRAAPSISRVFAWTPPVLPIALILTGLVFKEASFVGNPNIALLIGALVSIGMAREKSGAIISSASRRAGVIIFDLCGAGALGFVIAQSDLGTMLQSSFGQVLPIMVAPFLITALIQLAQGSRVVTVVIAADILKGYPLDGLLLTFLIASGAFMFSYVSDPYFWLVRETTSSGLKEMVRGYTLPLSICGMIAFAAVSLLFRG